MLKITFDKVAYPVALTCAPLYFSHDPAHPANAEEAEYSAQRAADPQKSIERACAQHKVLTGKLKWLGLTNSALAPFPGMGDQVYTADPGFTMYNPKTNTLTLIRSHFTNQKRQVEVDAFTGHIQALCETGGLLEGIELKIHDMPFPFEGTGDAYYSPFHDKIFAGYVDNPDQNNESNGRSAKEAHAELARLTGIPVISIKLKPPCYHIDTALCPLPSGHMLIYRDGIEDKSYNRPIQEEFIDKGLDPDEYVIPISKHDALKNFVTNLLCYDGKILLPYFGEGETMPDPSLIKRLEKIGYEVDLVEYGELIKAGGGLHCSGHILHQRIEGGIYREDPGIFVDSHYECIAARRRNRLEFKT